MFLDYDIEHKLEYSTDIEHSTLYSWCIRELDEQGRQISDDLVPWVWTLSFKLLGVFYSINVESERSGSLILEAFDQQPEPEASNKPHTLQERILARLKPWTPTYHDPVYKMMGSDRVIEDITVEIYKSSNEDDLRAYCWSVPSYKERRAFESVSTPDTLQFYVGLSPEHFDHIRDLVKMGNLGDAQMSFRRVSGFYSEWRPEGQPDFIKVLGQPDNHNLELPDDKKKDFWETGLVGEFKFRIGTANYKLPKAIKAAYESSDLDD